MSAPVFLCQNSGAINLILRKISLIFHCTLSIMDILGTTWSDGELSVPKRLHQCILRKEISMINFDEELKKFHPSLEIGEAEELIMNHSLTDLTDLLVDMVKQSEETKENK